MSEHTDEEPKDLICDYCGEELDGIKEVKITSHRSYIGVGESFSMSGEALTSGAVTNSAVTFSTESELVTLEQEGNTLKVTAGSEEAEAVVVKAVSNEDETKDAEVSFAIEGWSSLSKSRMSGTSGVLDGVNLPYFRTMSDLIKPIGATTVTGQVDLPEYKEAAQALVDGGYSKVEKDSKVFYMKDHPTKFGFAVQVEVQGVEIDDPESGYYNFIGSLVSKELTAFPAEAVRAVIGEKSTSQIPMPTDGTEFMVLRNDGSLIEVELNGDASAFISKLETGSYYINRDNTRTGYTTYVMSASPERTLLVHVSVKEGAYTITYTTQTIPNKSDWTNTEKTTMETNFGYVLPFVNVGFTYNSSKKIYTTSRVEAYDMIVEAYKANTDFTWKQVPLNTGTSTITGYQFIYPFSKYLELSVLVYRIGAQTTVQPSKITIPQEEWDTEFIQAAMGVNPVGESLPEAEGTEYGYYNSGNGFVQVNVTGDFDAYIAKLNGLGYSLTIDPSDGCNFGYSTLHSIYVEIYPQGSYFAIMAANRFENGYSATVPTSSILTGLGLESEESLVLPEEGGLFHYVLNGRCDVTLEVLKDGNMSNFVTALGTASFVETEVDSGVYTKDNVQITVIAGENGAYSINYTLLVKPDAPTDWDANAKSVIADLLEYEEWEIYSSLPYPTTVETVSAVSNSSTIQLTITGGNIAEYAAQLEQAGLYVIPQSGFYVVFEDEYDGSYYPIVIIDQGNGTYVIIGNWVLG